MENLDDQIKIDELVKFVLKNHNTQVKKSKEYCYEIYHYAKEMNKKDLIGFVLYYLGEADYIENNVEGLFLNITNALLYLDQTNQWELMARGYNLLGISFMSRGNAPYAIDYYLNALNYCKQYHLNSVSAVVNLNIGALYSILHEYETAEMYFNIGREELYQMTDAPKYWSYLMTYYASVGNIDISRGRLQEAKNFQTQAKEKCLNKVGNLDKISYYIFAARLFHFQDEIKQRNETIQTLFVIIDEEVELLSIFDDLFLLCELLLDVKKQKEFWKIINILQTLAEKSNIIHMQLQALDLKNQFFKKVNNQIEFLNTSGEYYELSQQMKLENQLMIKRMIYFRNHLEESKKQKKEMEEKNKILKEKSETDPLTGLNNRYRLNTYAEDVFIKANNQKTTLAVEILDIDYFKQYNDHYGHQAGDACIIKVAQQLKTLAEKEHVFCARYGGDEFILIFDNVEKEKVISFAKKLRKSIHALEIEHAFSKNMQIVTISQGICQDVPKKKNKVWDFLSTADYLLYQVKKKGRNNISYSALGNKEGEILISE